MNHERAFEVENTCSANLSCHRASFPWGYDRRQRRLELEFESAEVYRYFDVPQEVHDELMAADSKGIYVNLVIKPRFRYERLSR